ncbi:EAL domain-containing protein [Betaproteobacteria bacterium SCN1]|jgi:diguanylate cyclase (GGDEF)-like protein/PAS domain S-box-containing protein|nr:EAL domain-containing protein [Betaproteobacteria bacterium SCN1]
MAPSLSSTHSKPLRGLFYLMAGFLLIAYCGAVARHWIETRRDAEASLHYLNTTLVQNTRTTLRNYGLILRGIGTELVEKGTLDTPENGLALFERIRSIDPGMAGFGLARTDGQLILVSGIPPGAPLPNLVQQSETRESFLKSLQTGKLEIGRPYYMTLLKEWVIPVRVPLLDAQGGPTAVMTAGYPIEGGHSLLANATLPPNTATMLLRDDGYMQYFHPLPPGRRERILYGCFTRKAAPSTLERLSAQNPSKDSLLLNMPNLGGWHLVVHERIPEYGLNASALVPLGALLHEWLQRLIAPTLLFAAFLLGATLVYRRAVRRQTAADAAVARLSDWRETVLDSAQYSIISTDPAGVIVSFNATAERMLGYRADEMIGRATPERIHDAAEVAQRAIELSQALGERIEPGFEVFVARARRGETEERDWTYVRRDGSRFPVRLSVSALHAPDGHIEGFLGIAADLSAHKAAEAALLESRQTLIERNASLRAINQLSNRIHASLELDDILREAIDALAGLSHAPHIAIYLLSDDGNRLDLAASSGFDATFLDLTRSIPLTGSLCGEAVSSRRIIVSDDFGHDDRIQPNLRSCLASVGLRTGLVAPLVYHDQVLGGINIVYRERHAFSDIEIETFGALSNTVALAIANSRHVISLAFQARHDSLTHLPNRAVLHAEFGERVTNRGSGAAALMLLDLDRFKEVNDTLGHHVGDQLLTQIGPRLESALHERDALVCRLGGDEFALLIPDIGDETEAVALARHLRASLRAPFVIQGIALQIGASIGVAVHPLHGDTSHDLLRAADVAMYQAKQAGIGVAAYDRTCDTHSPERLTLAVELAHAVDNGELVLHYQPKLDLASRRVVGFEALVRWNNPRHGLLYPADFVHLAEINELIHPFTRTILDLAILDKQRLNARGHGQPIAINLSARNLLDDGLAAHLGRALDEGRTRPGEIELELTETALMQDPDTSTAMLRQLARLGAAVAVDDYGTGYSSLAYLRRLPLAALKIDRSFVSGLADSAQDAIIVRSTVALAHNLGLGVIAEGVENAATADALQVMGCDQAQGYYFSRPLPLDALLDWLDQRTPAPA